jgi:hypothetical protein
MHIAGPAPQIVDAERDVPSVSRLADQRYVERPEVIGEDGDDVYPQSVTSGP